MGARIAGHDWAATPLGPPEDWPQSLRTAVRIVLGSRFAMWMAWGPELTFFYNDAYAEHTLASKHPWALGRRADEVWEEIWDDIGPRIDQVLATSTATWDEGLRLFLQRSGYREETYHTFSYSPLTDDDGRTAGMLCVSSRRRSGSSASAAWRPCATWPPRPPPPARSEACSRRSTAASPATARTCRSRSRTSPARTGSPRPPSRPGRRTGRRRSWSAARCST